jgi:hypothetical protein
MGCGVWVASPQARLAKTPGDNGAARKDVGDDGAARKDAGGATDDPTILLGGPGGMASFHPALSGRRSGLAQPYLALLTV